MQFCTRRHKAQRQLRNRMNICHRISKGFEIILCNKSVSSLGEEGYIVQFHHGFRESFVILDYSSLWFFALLFLPLFLSFGLYNQMFSDYRNCNTISTSNNISTLKSIKFKETCYHKNIFLHKWTYLHKQYFGPKAESLT